VKSALPAVGLFCATSQKLHSNVTFWYRITCCDGVGRGSSSMNTAAARRLALGDRVVWISTCGYRPDGPGTVARVTVHEVDVCWDGGILKRYRRADLYNLRHVQIISVAEERGSRAA
jgi:hypothetical protein